MSCSGIQHYSALLRDKVGGRSVNLIDGEVPADVYHDVNEVCIAKTKIDSYSPETSARKGSEFASAWLVLGMNRYLTKFTVMTSC